MPLFLFSFPPYVIFISIMLLIKNYFVFLPNVEIISEIFVAVLTVHRVSMVTHQGPLLELGALWAGELHPPGPGGAHAQQVGGAGGGYVCIVTRGQTRTGEFIGDRNLKYD